MRLARYLVVIAVVLGGCGETTIDADKLEGEIAQGVEKQTGTRNVEVDCPDDVKAEEGGTSSATSRRRERSRRRRPSRRPTTTERDLAPQA